MGFPSNIGLERLSNDPRDHHTDCYYCQVIIFFIDKFSLMISIIFILSTGGNVLINIGPTSYGKILPIFEERLRQMGSWLKVNGEAIYSSIPWKYQNDTTNSHVW